MLLDSEQCRENVLVRLSFAFGKFMGTCSLVRSNKIK